MSDGDWHVIGFIWPDGFDNVAAQAMAGDLKARRAVDGVRAILVEIVDGASTCAECGDPIARADHMGACAIAQRGPEEQTVTIPFCHDCAATAELLSEATNRAVDRLRELFGRLGPISLTRH
jgi:hypothetical protein